MLTYLNPSSITFEFLVKYLIEFIAWIHISDSELEEMLKLSIQSNDIKQLVSTLWRIGPKRRAQVTSMVLQICGNLNRTEMVDCLLEQQLINPNVWTDRYEWSPLHKAVYKRDLALVQLLISKGVDIYSREINGNTALHIAIQSVRNPPTDLTDDTVRGDIIDIVALLITQCKNQAKQEKRPPTEYLVNLRNNFGKTALHYCVDLQPSLLSVKLITMLIHGGSLVDLADFKGRTPFFSLVTEFKRHVTCKDISRSPFIDILLSFDCDPLNFYRMLGKIPTLKHLCRQFIQSHFNSNDFNCLQGHLPDELIQYLNRCLVK